MDFSGRAEVNHHQFVLGSVEADTLKASRRGTLIELGPGFCTVYTGIAYGPANVRIEVYDTNSQPEVVTAQWDVVEEAALQVQGPLHILGLDGTVVPEFDVVLGGVEPGKYRVRAHARNRDTYWDMQVDTPTEDYLLQLWPSVQWLKIETLKNDDSAWSIDEEDVPDPPRPAKDVWTVLARNGTPDEPTRWFPPHVEYTRDPQRWGGRLPDGELATLLDNLASDPTNQRLIRRINELCRLDRDVVDLVVRSSVDARLDIARWTLVYVFEEVGLMRLDWVKDGVRAVAEGNDLPPRFRDQNDLFATILADPRCPTGTVLDVLDPTNDYDGHVAWQQALGLLYWVNDEEPWSLFQYLVSGAGAVGRAESGAFFAALKEHFVDGS